VILLLFGAAGGAVWTVTRLGWQRVSDDVVALVRYEEVMSRQGETALVMNVQDPSNVDWLVARRTQLDASLPAPLPIPVVQQLAANANIGAVTALDTNFVTVNVGRAYRAPGSVLAEFVLPQVYLRSAEGEWQHTAPPGHFWGAWQDWRSAVLFVRHSERDGELVETLAPRLEGWLRAACRSWSAECPPAKLYLSGFVGSMEYNPLDNVEVRVEFGAEVGALPPDYFLSVPSPQITGIPANPAAQDLLAEYLAVRLIASLANEVAGSPLEAMSLTAKAIEFLDLDRADPGFAALARQQADAQRQAVASQGASTPGARPSSSQSVPAYPRRAIWREYLIQPGDTLGGIAASYQVSVADLMAWNEITDADLIIAGATLVVPVAASFEDLPAP
jgi:hypothetical protein